MVCFPWLRQQHLWAEASVYRCCAYRGRFTVSSTVAAVIVLLRLPSSCKTKAVSEHIWVCTGIALRVPTPNVSVVDLVIQTEKKTFAEEVNEAFREYSRGQGDVSFPHPHGLVLINALAP